jgi:hypothetical protein
MSRDKLTRLIQSVQITKPTETSTARRENFDQLSTTTAINIAGRRLDIAKPGLTDQTTDPLMRQWLAIDKNPAEVREVIYTMTLDALNRLRLKYRLMDPKSQSSKGER